MNRQPSPCAIRKLGGFHFNEQLKNGDDDLDKRLNQSVSVVLIFKRKWPTSCAKIHLQPHSLCWDQSAVTWTDQFWKVLNVTKRKPKVTTSLRKKLLVESAKVFILNTKNNPGAGHNDPMMATSQAWKQALSIWIVDT